MNKVTDIINVVEVINGIIGEIQSFLFFNNTKDKNTLIAAEKLFAKHIRENYQFEDDEIEEEVLENAINDGVFTTSNGYEIYLVWSNINS